MARQKIGILFPVSILMILLILIFAIGFVLTSPRTAHLVDNLHIASFLQ